MLLCKAEPISLAPFKELKQVFMMNNLLVLEYITRTI